MSAAEFIAARDFLLECRHDYERAYREFRWPQLDRFNWALDFFDPMARELAARGDDRTALWIVNEGGGEQKLGFAEISERSSRVANHLRALGVRRGDRVLLMLGNVVPLWESMLAAMKLGAVVIPATTLLTRDDLIDRFERGRARHVITGAENTGKFAEVPGEYTRIAIRRRRRWMAPLRGRLRGSGRIRAGWRDPRHRPPAAVFHVRHDGPAEAGVAQSSELPGRPYRDDVLGRSETGRHPPQHLVARLGKARL